MSDLFVVVFVGAILLCGCQKVSNGDEGGADAGGRGPTDSDAEGGTESGGDAAGHYNT